MRIGAMCNFIWPSIVEYADLTGTVGLLPNDAEKLKPWIRGIAPDRAKKGGPPKKVKK